jgi:signal transduction histidine kinase
VSGPDSPESRRLRRCAETVLIAALTLFVSGLVADHLDEWPAPLGVAGVIVAGFSGVALWWRRSHPRTVMLVALAGSEAVLVLAPGEFIPYTGLVALYSLAAAGPPLVSLSGMAGLLAVSALNYWVSTPDEATFVMTFPVVVWAVGEATRARTLAVVEAARRVMIEQQAAIARELHDVIGHSVSVMVVQAAAADDVFDLHPDRARTALRAVEETGRAALAELRAMLPALREGVAPAPLAGALDRLDTLISPLVVAGLRVTVHRETAPGSAVDGPLPEQVEAVAYRIVQEALTNTLRHARASRADVVLRRSARRLEVEIRDDGTAGQARAGSDRPPGRGLVGMRERTEQLGGQFEAGPRPDGGFVVRALLPFDTKRTLLGALGAGLTRSPDGGRPA